MNIPGFIEVTTTGNFPEEVKPRTLIAVDTIEVVVNLEDVGDRPDLPEDAKAMLITTVTDDPCKVVESYEAVKMAIRAAVGG